MIAADVYYCDHFIFLGYRMHFVSGHLTVELYLLRATVERPCVAKVNWGNGHGGARRPGQRGEDKAGFSFNVWQQSNNISQNGEKKPEAVR